MDGTNCLDLWSGAVCLTGMKDVEGRGVGDGWRPPLGAYRDPKGSAGQVMYRLDHRLALDEKQLNISCLLYSPGQCIPWHADRHGGKEPVSPISFFPLDGVKML